MDDGDNCTTVDFYINSTEIWNYVINRFNQLVDTIYDVMSTRVEETIQSLKETPILDFSENPNMEYLNELITCDWNRGGKLHNELMKCKFVLNSVITFTWDDQYRNILIKYTWKYVQDLANSIQNMYECEEQNTSFYQLMSHIGCDSNQCCNLLEMFYEQCHFGTDCDGYQEYGVNNYYKCPMESKLDYNDRKNLYNQIKDIVKENYSRDKRIEIITEIYTTIELPRSEIARLFFIVVLPHFVEKYQLYDKLCSMDNYELFLYIVACGLIDKN